MGIKTSNGIDGYNPEEQYEDRGDDDNEASGKATVGGKTGKKLHDAMKKKYPEKNRHNEYR